MLRVDHLVVHIDNKADILEELKQTLAVLGFPFDPQAEKTSQGVAISNLWIGKQYLELVRLLQPSVHNWDPRWVRHYTQGKRGVFSLYIAVKNLDETYEGLRERGVKVDKPEAKQALVKASKDILDAVTGFLGLKQSKAKKTCPWRCLNLPTLPGTDMDISFLEYDEGSEDEIKSVMQPNSQEFGITRISRIKLYLPLWEESMEFLQKVFPQLLDATAQYKVELREGELIFFRSDPEAGLKLKLEATAGDKKYAGNRFNIENVEVKTVVQAV